METEQALGLGDSKIFYYEKCSHTVSRGHTSPIAKTNFANGIKVAGSRPVYLPVLNGPLQLIFSEGELKLVLILSAFK